MDIVMDTGTDMDTDMDMGMDMDTGIITTDITDTLIIIIIRLKTNLIQVATSMLKRTLRTLKANRVNPCLERWAS